MAMRAIARVIRGWRTFRRCESIREGRTEAQERMGRRAAKASGDNRPEAGDPRRFENQGASRIKKPRKQAGSNPIAVHG